MIFVSIASYTDPDLPRTLRDCLDNARWPADVRFGICWQADPAAPVPLDVFRGDSRFHFHDCSIAESEGGAWARSTAQRFWEGEEFTLQVTAKNAVAFEQLRKLLYSDGHEELGRYGLGSVRTLRDYEVYAGFDFINKRAHPDVFTGRPPDPVTIRSEADWARGCTVDEAFAGNPQRIALPALD